MNITTCDGRSSDCRNETTPLVIFLFLTTGVVTKTLDDGKRPGNSTDLIPDRFPFLVGVISSTFDQIVCTGTLINSYFVLTSAYCTLRLQPKIQLYHKSPTAMLQYRSAASVQVHPTYNSALRVNDLCLIKLTRPFAGDHDFVRLSSKVFKNNRAQLECVVAGIGKPLGRGYQIPVRVKYGRTACKVPKSNAGLKYIINYTWPEFMCAKVIGRSASPRQPCDHGDPLVCHGNWQYGLFSYGYRDEATSAVTPGAVTSECRDPGVQSRFLFVNKRADWIENTVSRSAGHGPADGDGRNAVNETRPAGVTTIETYTSQPGLTSNSTEAQTRSLDQDAYAYLVVLSGPVGKLVCGGTLVTEVHVLTSAYCTAEMSEIKATVMIDQTQSSRAIYIYVHPQFNVRTLFADISIILFPKPYEQPKANKTIEQSCMILLKQRMPELHFTPIEIQYGPYGCQNSKHMEIQKAIRMTWREFSCGVIIYNLTGYGGDPLICDGIQYGITSHAFPINKTNVTDLSEMQVRYLVVNNYGKWIDQVITFSSRSGAKKLRMLPALVILTAGLLRILLQYANM